VAKCGNNLSQIYKATRTYTTSYNQMLPDLFAGLATADHNVRYVESNRARTDTSEGEETTDAVPCGLWLLYTGGYAESKNLYYCPDQPGSTRYGGTENQLVNDLPKTVGYTYNCFPEMVTGSETIAFPEAPDNPTLEETANDVTQVRHIRFYALMSDNFLNSRKLTHWSRRGLNCCYWDGSVKWVSLATRGIPWNHEETDEDGEKAQTFSKDRAGAVAVRDTWVVLSEARR
jgi:hypothetical protein